MASRTAPAPSPGPAPGSGSGPSTLADPILAEPTLAEPTLAEPTSRPLRRDAELNLGRILAAAQDVFAESGFDASMEQIANRAGVGVGTLYRRFPNKESLVLAIIELAGQRSEALVHDVLAHATPAEGIFEFMRRCVGLAPSLRALVSRSPHLAETHRTMVDKLAPSVNRLLANAKAAGSIRSDVTFSDIAVILMSVRLVEDRCGEHGASEKLGRQQGERHLQLLVDGLRAKDSTLPHRPLTRAQLDDLLVRE
jgi:AcrR family transcriptional regulator